MKITFAGFDRPLAAIRSLITVYCLVFAIGPVRSAEWSHGNYRIPYANGSTPQVLFDHLTHIPPDRVDLFGGTNGNQIVAAADGVVRFIVETNTASCTIINCAAFNNYVWIEHPNGEWTKYSHLATGSATGAGILVGMNIKAGTPIGLEGNIGFTAVTNLEFEVGVPNDPSDPIVPAGGSLKGIHRAPVICGIPNNFFVQGQSYYARGCDAPAISRGVYRIPYADNTQVLVSRDHNTHSPVPVRYDLRGMSGGAPYKVVAAADGIVQAIVDTNTTTCSSCTAFNNYVWIKHPNGEWTKYTHFQTGTVTAPPPNGAGLFVGKQVCSGTYLGDEGNVGAASNIHLHFEVAVPTNATAPFQVSGGFINGYNLMPVMCGVFGSVMFDGMIITGDTCTTDVCARTLNLTPAIIWGQRVFQASQEINSDNSSWIVDTFASVAFRAGQKITLRPGFRASDQSFFHAAIRDCNQRDTLPSCR